MCPIMHTNMDTTPLNLSSGWPTISETAITKRLTSVMAQIKNKTEKFNAINFSNRPPKPTGRNPRHCDKRELKGSLFLLDE
ncbi:unnamed protein product [Nesidiocoris tenuis]|uniref:Uncharacterized protein n=1 Tax=Nesidiocoris tenuis TaxID=355587 RepID=A0A6H5FWT2_9HEMI|nr:unnamed protein product [Nesidiocoris tenuis]